MVPLVATSATGILKDVIDRVREAGAADEIRQHARYLVGTMIELPRAALARRRYCRDRRILQLRHQRSDADHVRHQPRRRGVLSCRITQAGISRRPLRVHRSRRRRRAGQFGVERGRAARPGIKLGICGEHGGDPRSVALLPQRRSGLCLLLALPRAHRAAGSGTGGDCRREELRLSPIN